MDLLKGCGDCRAPIDKTNLQHSASIYEPSSSTQRASSPSQCTPMRSQEK